jgi:putative ABC transport system permease protein
MPSSDFWRRLFRREDAWDLMLDEEVDQEIQTHLELRTAALVREGLTPEEAAREAARRFGDMPTALQALREGARRRQSARRHRATIDSVVADLRLAWRQVRRSPRFTLLTLTTFALGIGATTATFTLVRAVVLDPLPYPDPERLVALQGQDSLRNPIMVVSSADWLDWRRGARALGSTALHAGRRMAVQLDQEPVRVDGELVTADFFHVLEAEFVQGRSFTDQEAADRVPVAVVSEGFWRSMPRTDASTDRTVTVDSRAYRVVGVVRKGQEFPGGTQVYLPFHPDPATVGSHNNLNWYAIGRLRPGVTPAQAESELGEIARGIRAVDRSALYSYGVPLRPLKAFVVGDSSDYLTILMGAVLLVLLVACANLAAAHLARGLVRARETAVRAALGADRGRLVQQVLIEHTLLGLVGGGLGVLFAWGGVRAVLHLWGDRIPRSSEVALDLWVLGFAVVLSLGAGLLTGLAPALQASRPGLAGLIAGGGRGQVRGGRGLPGAILVVVELALALVLLTGAGLLIRSLQSLLSKDLGFDTNAVTISATLSDPQYRSDPARRVGYWDRMIAELNSLPGVEASGVANWIPLGMAGTSFVDLENGNQAPSGFGYRAVSEDYFRALGVPLLAGRGFGQQDLAQGERVVVINRRAAEVAWPGQSPLGKRFRASSFEFGGEGAPAPWLTVIGVVGDLRQWGPYQEPRAEMYTLFRQVPDFAGAMTAIARTTLPAAQLVPSVRARLRSIDPSVALELGTLEGKLTHLLGPQRLPVALLTGFGVFALLLTALGLYGLLSYSVSQRGREFALRAALGARRGQLVSAAAMSGVRLVLAGALIGLAAALALSNLLESLLVDVTPFDPLTYLLVLGLLLVVALLATLIPTLGVIRLDPAAVLNTE